MSINTEAQKDQAQLEREIAEQRAHLGETISALEERFSPGQMLDQVLAYGKENGGEFTHNLVNTVKNNPVPTLMLAVGAAWLMYGSNNRNLGYGNSYGEPMRASYGLDPDYDASSQSSSAHLKDTALHAKDKASQLTGQVKSSVRSSLHGARETANHVRHSLGHAGQEIRHQAYRASDGFGRLLREQPLAVGAMGIALGALIGGSLPSSRTEDRLMGDKRDRVMEKAKAMAGEAAHKAENLGQKVKQEIKEDLNEASSFNSYSGQPNTSQTSAYSGQTGSNVKPDNGSRLNS